MCIGFRYPSRTPCKPFGVGAGMFPNFLAAAAGTPSNLGKVDDAGELL